MFQTASPKYDRTETQLQVEGQHQQIKQLRRFWKQRTVTLDDDRPLPILPTFSNPFPASLFFKMWKSQKNFQNLTQGWHGRYYLFLPNSHSPFSSCLTEPQIWDGLEAQSHRRN